MTDLKYDEFYDLFEQVEHTVFQLEARESYAGVAAKPFRQFLAGNLDKVCDSRDPWLQRVRDQTAAGIRYMRVRIISEPWSDYTRFGLWECGTSVEAGEDLRYMRRDQAISLGLLQHDFRLFDSRTLVVLHYDDATLPRDEYIAQVG